MSARSAAVYWKLLNYYLQSKRLNLGMGFLFWNGFLVSDTIVRADLHSEYRASSKCLFCRPGNNLFWLLASFLCTCKPVTYVHQNLNFFVLQLLRSTSFFISKLILAIVSDEGVYRKGKNACIYRSLWKLEIGSFATLKPILSFKQF